MPKKIRTGQITQKKGKIFVPTPRKKPKTQAERAAENIAVAKRTIKGIEEKGRSGDVAHLQRTIGRDKKIVEGAMTARQRAEAGIAQRGGTNEAQRRALGTQPQAPLTFGERLKEQIGTGTSDFSFRGKMAPFEKEKELPKKLTAPKPLDTQGTKPATTTQETPVTEAPTSAFGGTEAVGGGLPLEAPDVFQQQVGMAGEVLGADIGTAIANQEVQETAREQQLRTQLSKLSLGDEEGNVLQALEGTMGKLSLQQLEQLAQSNGLELTDEIESALKRDGLSAIETERIAKEERLAENEYTRRQIARQFERAITDREDFNAQQDKRLRRLAASFGGGKIASMGANVAVMQKAEEGRKAVEDLRSDFSDKTMLVSKRADTVIDTYNNNVRIIEGQMSEAIENKYAEITSKIDDLLQAGVTNEVELNNAVLKAKKDYMKTYADVSTKAFEAIEKQNQQFFENQITLRELRLEEEKQRQTSFFTDSLGQPISTPTSDSSGMQPVPTQSTNGGNCVLYCREQVPNLPFGLFTKADKKRAVDQFGFRDPSDVQIGDAVLTAEGDVGHAAIVVGIEGNNLILEEANYVNGQVTKGRKISVFDSNIYGFIDANGQQAMNTGGNVQQEGTNPAIQDQVTLASQFQPQTRGEQLALQLAKGQVDILDLQRQGATPNDIAQLQFMSDQIKTQFPELGTEKARQIAQDMFNLTSTQKLTDLPVKERAAVATELGKLKEQALASGDFEGVLRSSAGGQPLDATAIQKLSKTATVVNQVGLLNNALDLKSIKDDQGNVLDLSPLKGWIRRKNPWDAPAQEINAIIQGTIPNLARGVFGEVGVLTDRDVELYRKTLPTLSQTDQVKKSVTAITLRTLRSSLEDQLAINAGAGRDVSGLLPKYNELNEKIQRLEGELGIVDPERPNPFISQATEFTISQNIAQSGLSTKAQNMAAALEGAGFDIEGALATGDIEGLEQYLLSLER
jgi:hypothetical protein